MFRNKNIVTKNEIDNKKSSFEALENCSHDLSQFCKSSQFLRDIELAMCECDSPSTTKDSKVVEKPSDISSEIIGSNSAKWKEKSPDFSYSTDEFSDSILKNSYNTQAQQNNGQKNLNETQGKIKTPKKFSLSLRKTNIENKSTVKNTPEKSIIGTQVINSFDDDDPFLFKQPEKVATLVDEFVSPKTIMNIINSDIKTQNKLVSETIPKKCDISFNHEEFKNNDLNCTISRLLNSTEYKKQVIAGFDNLETSIINDRSNATLNENIFGVPSNITINHFDWNETIGQSEKKTDDNKAKYNNSNFEDFKEIGPFYGLPQMVKTLIQQVKGIEELYDWQDECLKLDSIKKRKNLVYSLPTSGGKTLVSEILIMREILCHKKNALLVLPYVAIVQEKISAFSPFAVSLEFLLEEYAAGKGKLPPRKRRFKNAVYIATIEKALSLVNSLIEVGRLSEIGLVVVDELHLIGEDGRGTVLEMLLTKILASGENIQIVGMSATIGNLNELCQFLKADHFTKDFRPVELEEYVCCAGQLALSKNGQLEQVGKAPDKGYTEQMLKLDPDRIGAFVNEVIPNGSCLLFCPTKKNCENVALLLTKILPKELLQVKNVEKFELMRQMEAEGVMCDILRKTLPFGIAYHHSGLTMDERRLIEDAFRSGTLCVICCTSTLAAGVNLPAQRVILRSPYVGIEFISLARYKQMVGRAGRAGLSEVGQSILICEKRDMDRVRLLLNAPMDETVSKIPMNNWKGLKGLILSCIALNIENTRKGLQKIAYQTLMSVQENRWEITPKAATDQAITELFKQGALQAGLNTTINPDISILMQTNPNDKCQKTSRQLIINNDTQLVISKLGKAAIKSGLDLEKARLLYEDLVQAQASLVLLTSLHLLYLVIPYELANQIKPSPATYYNIYTKLTLKELETAKVIGITESCALRMISGRKITTVSERVLNRFYLSLMLYFLWNETPVPDVARTFNVNRGLVQQLMTSSATFSSSIVNFCEELEQFWPFADMFRSMTTRLHHCASRELLPLMDLPNVKIGRAKQLYNAGFKTLQSIAKADPEELVRMVENLPRKVANQLVSTAKLLLLEKVENLREEAQDVLEEMES